jgi:hypothetical protein
MNPQDAKIAVRAAKTQTGVYSALEKAGVDTSRPLEHSRRLCRQAMHWQQAELIDVAIMRLRQIDNKEI